MSERTESPDHVFPLRLSSIERFHLLDSSAKFPNLVTGRLVLDGTIDREAAEQAALAVMQRQPMLQCRLQRRHRRQYWCHQPSVPVPICWREQSADAPPRWDVDLATDLPWRMTLDCESALTTIWFEASHALIDGLGACQLISDWLRVYEQLISASSIRLPRLDIAQLRTRNRIGMNHWSYWKHAWRQPIGLYGAAKFVLRRPQSLTSVVVREPLPATGEIDQQPGTTNFHSPDQEAWIIGIWLDECESRSLRQFANSSAVSVNAIALGALFRSLAKFLGDRKTDSNWLRVLLPMSIRSMSDRRLPAANRATVVQIDRGTREVSDANFLVHLDREVKIIRDWELSKLFLLSLKWMALFPALLARSATSTKCRGTAILANLGEPLGRIGLARQSGEFVAGNLSLKEFDFVGPIRDQTPVNFTVAKHLGRYRFSIHADARLLSRSEATNLLTSFRSSVVDLATANHNTVIED